MALVLVDGENVRRSVWPNIDRGKLEPLVDAWAADRGLEARVIWEGRRTADDVIVEEARVAESEVWVATSDRELRTRVAPRVTRLVGGGNLARALRGGETRPANREGVPASDDADPRGDD